MATGVVACGDDDPENEFEASSFVDFALQENVTFPDVDVRAGHTLAAAINPNWPDDMWIATRHVIQSGDSTNQVGYFEFVVIIPDAAATVAVGQQVCKIDFNREIEPVEGFDPFDRMQVRHAYTADTCSAVSVGTVGAGIWETIDKDADKRPTFGRRWLQAESSTETSPNWRAKGGIAAPWRWCQESDKDANGFCPFLCANRSNSLGLPAGYADCATTLP